MPKFTKCKTKAAGLAPRNTRAQANRQSALKLPRLPNEVIDSILEMSKLNGDFVALRTVAQASRDLYNLAIPKIYETVMFNEKNLSKINYGHGRASPRTSRNGERLRPTRKDLAVAYTRKLVFNKVPKHAVSRYYRNVNEVAIGHQCLSAIRWYCSSSLNRQGYISLLESHLAKCLKTITSSNSLVDRLHIKLCLIPGAPYRYNDLGTVLASWKSAIPCTYEFYCFHLFAAPEQLHMAYTLQGVVHFASSYAVDRSTQQARVAQGIALRLDECFEEEDVNAPIGQVFLCDAPACILSSLEDSKNYILPRPLRRPL